MEKLMVLRHGPTEKHEGIKGRENIPLSEEGKQYLSIIGQIMDIEQVPFEIVISSPLERAVESAQILNRHHCRQFASPFFNELDIQNLGKKAQGLALSDYDQLAREAGAETSAQALGRMLEGLDALKTLPQKNGLLVSHSIVMNLLAAALSRNGGLQLEGPFDYGCGFLVDLNTMTIEAPFPPARYFEP